MLTTYYCNECALKLPTTRRMPSLKQWLSQQLEVMRGFTPDGQIHCTDCVADEFRPAPVLAELPQNVQRSEYLSLKKHVCSLLFQVGVDASDITFLRQLPTAPRRLVGPSGLSNNDLSLVVLGIQLTAHANRVYLLTNDQDLLSFVSWLRAKPEVRARWGNMRLLQGLHGLAYLETIHRGCDITTDLMGSLIQFAIAEHYSRAELVGTQKGTSILHQLLQVNACLMQSVAIKLAAEGATQ